MKGYEDDVIVQSLEQQLAVTERNVLSGFDKYDLARPRTVMMVKKEIIERQQPIFEAMVQYIATHPTPFRLLKEEYDRAVPV